VIEEMRCNAAGAAGKCHHQRAAHPDAVACTQQAQKEKGYQIEITHGSVGYKTNSVDSLF